MIETLVLCIAFAIYYEAKDAPLIAKEAVAQAVLNRVRLSYGSRDACDVVFEPYAFPWVEAMHREPPVGALNAAVDVSWAALSRSDFIDRATHFHPVTLCPAWTVEMRYVATHGGIAFYSAIPTRKKGGARSPPAPCKPHARR